MDKILPTIETQINYYYENVDKLPIHASMNLREKMAIYSYYLADYLAAQEKQQGSASYDRRMYLAKSYLQKKSAKIADDKVTDKFAEMASHSDAEEYFLRELEIIGYARKTELLLKQLNVIIDVL